MSAAEVTAGGCIPARPEGEKRSVTEPGGMPCRPGILAMATEGNVTAVKYVRRRPLVLTCAAVVALAVGSIAAKAALTAAQARTALSTHAGTASRAPGRTVSTANGTIVSLAPGAIVIDPSIGDTFTPAPASAVPVLTAAQAWAQYAQVNGLRATMPSGLSVQLGLLSVPVGPANPDDADQAGLATSNGIVYTALNKLAYGYSSPIGSCPMSRNPNNPGPVGKSCIDWTFVDANSGQLIEATAQVLG